MWQIDQRQVIKYQLLGTLKVVHRIPFCFPSTLSRPDIGLIIFQGIDEGHSQLMSHCPTISIRISWKSKEIKCEAITHKLRLASI